MKRARQFLGWIVCGWMASSVFASDSSAAKPASVTINALIAQIRAKLPQGWTVTLDSERDKDGDAMLDINCIAKVLAEDTLPNSPPVQKPELVSYWMVLHAEPYISKEEYRRFQAENERTQKKLNALRDDLIRRGVAQKFDSFSADGENRDEVGEYDRLKQSLHRLPDFFFKDISLELQTCDYEPTDAKMVGECDSARAAVIAGLSRY